MLSRLKTTAQAALLAIPLVALTPSVQAQVEVFDVKKTCADVRTALSEFYEEATYAAGYEFNRGLRKSNKEIYSLDYEKMRHKNSANELIAYIEDKKQKVRDFIKSIEHIPELPGQPPKLYYQLIVESTNEDLVNDAMNTTACMYDGKYYDEHDAK